MLAVLLPLLSLHATLLPPSEFTTAAAVRALPVAAADGGRAVCLTGVVTFSPPRGAYFYLQDGTGGVRVEWLANRNLRSGERVLVVGRTTGGTFLPEVRAARVISTCGPCEELLPRPVWYTLALDDSGYLDGQWVEAEAVVQRVWQYDGWLQFDLARGRGSAVAAIPAPLAATVRKAEQFVGGAVKLRGVCKASTGTARQVIGPPRILLNDLSAFEELPGHRCDANALQPTRTCELSVFRPDPLAARLPVRVDGVVTFNQGRQLYVHDGHGVVQAVLTDNTRVKSGTRVSVVGFPRPPSDLIRLDNARLRVFGPGDLPPPPPGATPAQAAAGRLEGQVVRFSGLVHEAGRQGDWMTLTVVADGLTFTVVVLESLAGRTDPVPPAVPGSTVEVLGVATKQPMDGIRRTAFVVAVRPGVLKVLSVPPGPPELPPPAWWTGRRVAYLSAGFLGLSLLGGATVTALRLQVRRAKALARQESEEKARLEGRLEQAARLEAVGRVAGGVAHDFNNILTVINGCAQLLDAELSADPTRAATLAADIRRAGRLATALNSLLLAFSKQRSVAPHPLDVDAVIGDAAPVLGRLLPRGSVFRVTQAPGLPPVRAEIGMLLQILINLTVNAGEAMPDGGTFALATSAPEPGWVRVTATDTGTGMTPEVQARAFERGFTTKHAGTGTGLSTVSDVVQALGGRVRLRSEVGRGTVFEIDLPAAAPPALPPGRAGAGAGADRRAQFDLPTALVRTDDTAVYTSPTPRNAPVVLLVEDDDNVRSYVCHALERAGFTVLAAAEPEAALTLLVARRDRVDLLLTDLTLPGLSGRELAERVRAERPGVRILFVSGSDEFSAHADGVNFLQKPFSPPQLVERVNLVLGQPV
ncbi:MAG: response regulator [Planctomycetes bacterium]|nr:response regulator [Planctomycetota bacterium]